MNLSLCDKIISKYESILDYRSNLSKFVSGMLIGDSYLLRKGNTASIKLQDTKNKDYLEWKLNKLSKYIKFTKNGKRYDSDFSYDLLKYTEMLDNRNPLWMFNNNYSDLGLAIWYMDDGHFDNVNSHCRCIISVKRLKNVINKDLLQSIIQEKEVLGKYKLEYVVEAIKEKTGIEATYNIKNGSIIFNKENSLKLMERICKYIPKCMEYKLADEYKNRYEEFELFTEKKIIEDYVNIISIRNASKRQMRYKGKYDLSIKDNHNYMVGGKNNGIIIHNSPETTTGGNALKFYASQRLEVRKTETVGGGKNDDDDATANKIRIKIVKNKLAPPFKKREFLLEFGKGINKYADLLDISINKNIIDKKGAWYSYGEEKIGQGAENAYKWLESNKDKYDEVYKKVIDLINPPTS